MRINMFNLCVFAWCAVYITSDVMAQEQIKKCDLPLTGWQYEPIKSSQPSARAGALSAQANGGITWMFGGLGLDNKIHDDLWTFNNQQKTWKSIKVDINAAKPHPRYLGHACFHGGKLVIFGGHQGNQMLNDTWIFSEKDMRWEQVSGQKEIPTARSSAAVWCIGPKMYVFSGYAYIKLGVTIKQDMWIFDIEKRAWEMQVRKSDEYPIGRYGSARWTDERTSKLYLFGGCSKGDPSEKKSTKLYENDMWVFSTKTSEFTCIQKSTRMGNTTKGYYGDQSAGDLVGRPGGRIFSAAWIDNCGYMWLFSGFGYGEYDNNQGIQSDLWYFRTQENKWISSGGFQEREMGTFTDRYNESSPDNFPGSLWMSTYWSYFRDMYLFGGLDPKFQNAQSNALWRLTWHSLSELTTSKTPVPPKPVSIWTVVVLVGGILVAILLLVAVIKKCCCAKKPQNKFSKVKYQKVKLIEE